MNSELCRNRIFYLLLSLLNPLIKIIFVVIIVKTVIYVYIYFFVLLDFVILLRLLSTRLLDLTE
jgi:hypothetical protein